VEIVLNEKMYTHLDKEECDVETLVLDTGVINHISSWRTLFVKLNMVVLRIVCFSDDSADQDP
jgi:hypothetical protein